MPLSTKLLGRTIKTAKNINQATHSLTNPKAALRKQGNLTPQGLPELQSPSNLLGQNQEINSGINTNMAQPIKPVNPLENTDQVATPETNQDTQVNMANPQQMKVNANTAQPLQSNNSGEGFSAKNMMKWGAIQGATGAAGQVLGGLASSGINYGFAKLAQEKALKEEEKQKRNAQTSSYSSTTGYDPNS